MIEIAPYRHLAIVPLLAFSAACVLAAIVLMAVAAQRFRPSMYLGAIAAGLLLALGSGMVRSSRHAGTGIETAWGWPRVIYARWSSWEVAERREGVRWQGLAENTVFYGAAAALVGGVIVAARRAT